jgi:acetyl esterase/lipase
MKLTSKMIDPELRWRGRIMRLLLRPETPAAFLRLKRLSQRTIKAKWPSDMQVSQVWIPRRDGGRLRLMIYQPLQAGERRPGLLWIHGGGYLIGVPEQDKNTYRQLIAAGDCVIVAPDYRLGSDAPYPAALHDCYDALLWLKQHADELGVRDDQLAVAGMSAGGGLTAALTLYARDQGEVQVAFQMPLYPMIDDRMNTESATDNHAPVWNSVSNRVGWQVYLGELYGKDVPPYAAAARSTDYRGLPPTCTFVGDLEPFRDETLRYVQDLKAAEVPVAFELYPGAYHGFDVVVPKAAISRQATAFLMRWFEFAVQNYFAPQRKQDRAGEEQLLQA